MPPFEAGGGVTRRQSGTTKDRQVVGLDGNNSTRKISGVNEMLALIFYPSGQSCVVNAH
jgi:hypothetical protein